MTPRTLKYYEERGLVSPTRSEGRYRLYDEEDLQRFGRILRLRSLGFSLHGISEMLKRPIERVGGKQRVSTGSLQQIHDAIAGQAAALDGRIRAMRRELREAQKLREQLNADLDHMKHRLAGQHPHALLEKRRLTPADSNKARNTGSAVKPGKNRAKNKAEPTVDSTQQRAKKPRAPVPLLRPRG